MEFVLHFELGFINMQEEREDKKKKKSSLVSLQQRNENEEEGERSQRGFLYQWASCGPHWPLKLQSFKTHVCRSRMKSTKKNKMILQKSSFKKIYF